MDVILATASRLPRIDEDQGPLLEALAAAGVSAQALAWDDARVDWGQAHACVIRSTWNYVRHHDAFLAWAQRCAAVTALFNPLSIVRWNSHKGYLLELARAGLPVVPTRLVRCDQGDQGDQGGQGGQGDQRDRRDDVGADLVALAGDWPEVVIKPAVSAGSFGTLRVARAGFAAGQAHLDALRAASHDVLVQPFLPSVETYGERALVWIDGALTHAVRKSPRFAGDPQRISPAVPIASDEAVLAEAILAAVPRPLLYARVDLARDDEGRPCLMELELIEPSLFLDRSAGARARLVEAIRRLVTGVSAPK